VSRFLENHPEFSPIAPRQAWPDAPDAAAFASPDWLRLTPLRDGTDGFFAAVLERRAAAQEPAA
jgi:16S rRNA (cytosine967-C5)-methyltransferase